MLLPSLALALLCACQPDMAPQDPELPKPEHPRPDLARPQWSNLNGWWSFAHDPDDQGLAQGWQDPAQPFEQQILVPFAFESTASGLGEPFPDDGTVLHAMQQPTYKGVSWYQRVFAHPGWDSERVFLHLGAVDWRCQVWLNGELVGRHEGGWLPFELDVSAALRQGFNQLVLRVEDPSEDEPDLLIGKQGGVWYTRSSGIWQTVWLEARPRAWLRGLWFHPDWRTGQVELELELGGLQEAEGASLTLSIEDPRGQRAELRSELERGAPRTRLSFDLASLFPDQEPALWSPADPALYQVSAALQVEHGGGEDQVTTWFGLRGFGAQWAPGHGPDDGVPVEEQYQVFTLNDEPIYLRGVLDQNYHPEGLLSYPSEEALLRDLELVRELGFNLLRVHIMHPEPRKLYHCDRLGLLVMQDIPTPHMYLDNVAGTPARDYWWADLERAWHRDHNHPSLVAWVLFNEAWGLLEPSSLPESEELQRMVRRHVGHARHLDPSRLVEDDSPTDVMTGAYDHVDTDIVSWHYYSQDWDEVEAHLEEIVSGSYPGSELLFVEGEQQAGQPLLLSEFAGAGAYSTVGLEGWEIGEHFLGWVNAIRRYPKLAGYIFTQLTDVEWERNGLATYQRELKELGLSQLEGGLAAANGEAFLVLEGTPNQAVAAGETLALDLTLARGGDGAALSEQRYQVSWELLTADEEEPIDEGSLQLEVEFGLSAIAELQLKIPAELPAGSELVLLLQAHDEAGERVAGNLRRLTAE